MGNLSGGQTSGQFPIIHQFRITIFVDIYWGENDLFSATCLHQSLSIWYQMVSVGLSYQRLKLIEFGLKLLDARQNLRLSHAFNQSHFSFWDTHFVLHFWLAGTLSRGNRLLGSGGSSLNHQGMVQGKKKTHDIPQYIENFTKWSNYRTFGLRANLSCKYDNRSPGQCRCNFMFFTSHVGWWRMLH